MKYVSAPKRIIGAAMCTILLWTSYTTTGVFGDAHDLLRTGLEEIKTSLDIPIKLVDTVDSDPQYKKMLNLVGSWFMGDQIGENAIKEGISSYTPDVLDQLRNLLPILKHTERKMTQEEDFELKIQSIVIENALHINEILTKISKLDKSDCHTPLKKASIEKLNDLIFNAVNNYATVLIPAMWNGPKPGGILMSLSFNENSSREKYILRVYDTDHKFYKNEKKPIPTRYILT